MKQVYLLAFLLTFIAVNTKAQITFTANDPGSVPAYTSDFYYGSNMGYYPPWTNQNIADIAAGNPSVNVKGAGVKSLHLPLPEDFLETWGYNISINDFIHYTSLGIKDLTVFLENPATAHRDNTVYPGCTDQSLIWSNIYLPIWDGGAGGTPVNDNNYLALYIYKTVTLYKPYVKFWELVNEPDFDAGINGWKSPGVPGNWWDANPSACELLNLKAPIFNYIRMMRIFYEVVKYVDPTAYVAMGGAAYPSFIDAMCRNTDNPADGSANASYPLGGGAYFDCLSFHYYPMYDLGTSNRHSDAALDAYIVRKNLLNNVLTSRGYNGVTYPKKVFINTENNISRKSIGGLIGGDEVQRNYIMKAITTAQLNDIRQFYIFSIGDNTDIPSATDPFQVVGLYQPLEGIAPYNQQYNSVAVAYKTFSDLLSGYKADAAKTALMALPAGVRGGAFKNAVDDYRYVLWAATSTDNSETASATYSFPAATNVPPQVYKAGWDFFQTNDSSRISSQNIALTGSPVIILAPLIVTALNPDTIRNNPATSFSFALYPNPVTEKLTIKLHLVQAQTVSVKIFDGMGQLVINVADNKFFNKGDNLLSVPVSSKLAAGIYYCHMLAGGNREQVTKFIVTK